MKNNDLGETSIYKSNLIGPLIILPVVVGILTWIYYLTEKQRIRSSAEIHLSAIAQLKVKIVVDWRKERLADAQVVMSSRSNVEHLAQLINDPTSVDSDASREWLESLIFNYNYASANFVDLEGNSILEIGEPNSINIDSLSLAITQGSPIFTNIHRELNNTHLHSDLIIPLTSKAMIADSQPFGVLVLAANVETDLFKSIQSWPTPSETSESLLVRKEDDNVVFLNRLRHTSSPGLNIRMPITNSDLPAALALRGLEGVIEGKDYRGTDVLAIASIVPNSPWYMICKTDIDEIELPLQYVIVPILFGAFFMIVAAATGFGFLWNHRARVWLKREVKDREKRFKIEKNLHLEKERFRVNFEKSIIGMTISSSENSWLEVNPYLLELLDYSWDDFKSKSLEDLTHPDDWDAELKKKQALSDGKIDNYSIQKRFLRSDNRFVTTIVSACGVRNPDGSLKYIMSQIQDISDYLKNEMRYRTIFDFAPVSIWEQDWSNVVEMINRLDEKNRSHFSTYLSKNPNFITRAFWGLKISEINHETLRIFGAKTKVELLKSLKQIFVNPQNLSKFGDCLNAFHAGKRFYKTEISLHVINHRQLHADLNLTFPDAGKGATTVLVSILDLTERKKAEEKLKQSSEELKQRNMELEKFAYVSSHDLNEPLRTISSFSQLLASRYQGKLDSDADEFIQFIVDGVGRMQNLIKDLLTYSRVGTHGKPASKVQCDLVIQDVLSDLSLIISESKAKIECDPLPDVMGDDVQLRQLFQNLIGNAIKFHHPDKPPCIQIKVMADNQGWRFEVRDNGIGIDPQYFERIFVIFQRLHGRDSYPGTGVGLAVSQKIVERHGGRIWVESEPGNGSTFCFILPRLVPCQS